MTARYKSGPTIPNSLWKWADSDGYARFCHGASGWIGSAVIPELIGAGHEVTGLARSDSSAAALTAAGARVHRGDLDDPGGLRSAAGASDGVIHYGDGDHGFLAAQVAIARAKGVSGFIGDGSNRWSAAHQLDAAHLFRLALENAPAGSRLHAVADEGVPTRTIAEVIGRHLAVPVVSIPAQDASEHFGRLAGFLAADNPASSALTRKLLGWQPTQPGLVEDLGEGHYFRSRPASSAAPEGRHGGTS
jgi:nucleoside-diphosphate-sugar epimerase